jgi:hypothetical protein
MMLTTVLVDIIVMKSRMHLGGWWGVWVVRVAVHVYPW